MKKVYFLLLLFVSATAGLQAQCTVNANDTTVGISPPDSLIPPIIRNVAYDTVVQVYVPNTFTFDGFTVTLYWVDIDTITNAPTGINYTHNPANDTIYAGARACYQLFGTTSDTVGVYKLSFGGWVKVMAPPLFDTPTVENLSALQALESDSGAPQFSFSLTVQNAAGINDISAKLASVMQVLPNPNNGQFDVKLDYNGELKGDIRVLDALGNTVYVQPMSSRGLYTSTINLANLPKGIYAVQVNTANGTASKLVSVE